MFALLLGCNAKLGRSVRALFLYWGVIVKKMVTRKSSSFELLQEVQFLHRIVRMFNYIIEVSVVRCLGNHQRQPLNDSDSCFCQHNTSQHSAVANLPNMFVIPVIRQVYTSACTAV